MDTHLGCAQLLWTCGREKVRPTRLRIGQNSRAVCTKKSDLNALGHRQWGVWPSAYAIIGSKFIFHLRMRTVQYLNASDHRQWGVWPSAYAIASKFIFHLHMRTVLMGQSWIDCIAVLYALWACTVNRWSCVPATFSLDCDIKHACTQYSLSCIFQAYCIVAKFMSR